MTQQSAYDEGLSRLSAFGPSLKNGLFNHAPMAIEALAAMKQGHQIDHWIDRYAHELAPRESMNTPANEPTLGDREAFETWSAYFRERLTETDWQSVLDEWCHRLAPGFVTAACHGFLRTAHAARALNQHYSDIRRNELADGLAAWASMYAELPVPLLPFKQDIEPAIALEAMTQVPEEHRPARGLIVAGYAAVSQCPYFAEEVSRVKLSGDLALIDQATIAFSVLFNRAAHDDFTAIVLTHAVTGTNAVAKLNGIVSQPTLERLLGYAWQGGCALKVAFGHGDGSALPWVMATTEDAPSIAVENGDDHVIKLTEACLDVYGRQADPALLTTIDRVRQLLAMEGSE